LHAVQHVLFGNHHQPFKGVHSSTEIQGFHFAHTYLTFHTIRSYRDEGKPQDI